MLDQIRDNQDILGEWAEMLTRRADAIREAYAKAVAGMSLDLPDEIDEADPAKPNGDAAPAAKPEAPPESAPAELSSFDL